MGTRRGDRHDFHTRKSKNARSKAEKTTISRFKVSTSAHPRQILISENIHAEGTKFTYMR